jgi:hypothetical protein
MLNGIPGVISSWMWEVCANRNGQYAKQIAPTAEAQRFPVRYIASRYMPSALEKKATSTTVLCAI